MKIEIVELSKLKPNENNPRKISKAKLEELKKSLQAFPDMLKLRPLIVDENNVVIGGNQRFTALIALGIKSAPVIYAQGLTPERRKEFIVRDNAHYGEWDFDFNPEEWNFDSVRDWGVTIPTFANAQVGFSEDENEKENGLSLDVKPGQIIEIGQHKILCGDSTLDEDVKKLFAGRLADLIFTDPPYGVNVKGGRNNKNIEGDLTQTAIPFSFELCMKYSIDTGRFYFCGGESNVSLYYKLFDRHLAQMPKLLVWVKDNFVIKRFGYHNQYELIFYGYKKGGGIKWFGSRKGDDASDVWQIRRDASSSYVHPTQKPIEIAARAIQNSSKKGDVVYDAFLGSGSTMVAAHKLGRVCYGVEIDTHYCSAIIRRMLACDPLLQIKIDGAKIDGVNANTPRRKTEAKQ